MSLVQQFQDVSFNANLLKNVPGLTILGVDNYNPAKRKAEIIDIARSDRSNVPSAFYNQRIINVRIGIQTATRGATELSVEQLMSYLQGLKKDLLLHQSNQFRRFEATLTDVVPSVSGGAYYEAALVFTCSDRFGYDVAPTSIKTVTGFTSAYRADTFNAGGSAPWQAPIVQVEFTAIGGSPVSGSVLIGNQKNGQQLTITRTWTTGDILIVNSQLKTVQVNGVDVSFTGAFPEFSIDPQNNPSFLTYADSFTSRTFNYNAYYYRRFD